MNRQRKRLKSGEIAPSYFEKIEGITEKYFIPYFQTKDVREIRTADVQDFQLTLSGLKTKTQSNIMALLHKYFCDLYDREEIKRLPKFKKIEVPDPHWNWVDIEEQELIYSHIPEAHKPIFAFMMMHGCRPGEARALWREDINFKEKTTIIRRSFSNDVYRKTTKTKRERLIPLHDEVIDILKKQPVVSGFIFLDPNTDKPYRRYRLNRIFDKARKDAGIEDLTLYQWSKHSFCSQAINRGVPHKLVNEMVGTKSERASRRYQHVNVTGLRLTLRKKAKIIHMEIKKKAVD